MGSKDILVHILHAKESETQTQILGTHGSISESHGANCTLRKHTSYALDMYIHVHLFEEKGGLGQN